MDQEGDFTTLQTSAEWGFQEEEPDHT